MKLGQIDINVIILDQVSADVIWDQNKGGGDCQRADGPPKRVFAHSDVAERVYCDGCKVDHPILEN